MPDAPSTPNVVAVNGGVSNTTPNATTGVGGTTPDVVGTNIDDLEVLWRGDTRTYNEVFNNGFLPKDPDGVIDLEVYINSVPSPDSQYVSFTTDINTAKEFGTDYFEKPGQYYIVDKPQSGVIDVEKAIPGKAAFDEREIVIPGGILACNIRGVNCLIRMAVHWETSLTTLIMYVKLKGLL